MATTEKAPNYTPAQEQIILDAIRANGNVGNLSIATALAADARMNDADGNARKPRGITAKMARMAEAHGFTYARKQPTTKSGQPVQKKLDLVSRIASLADVSVEKLDGLEKAPKLALETLANVLAA